MCPWGKCPGGNCPGGFCPVTRIYIRAHSCKQKHPAFCLIYDISYQILSNVVGENPIVCMWMNLEKAI